MDEGRRDPVEVATRVRYAETDQMGVAYYANHFVWFEVGRSEFCRQRGFAYRQLEEEWGLYLVVVEARCRYLAPARYDDEIIIRTWLGETRKRSLSFRYEILGEDGRKLAEGETVHVVVDREGRARTLPPIFIERLRRGAGA
ncbi:MAG: acyl-CoA thioesterase [Blastocatellia bacterium]|nr:acyl-CoA thioesterase [Blastocatellia bacterium]MCS7156787.1 acyl-CoA thioesterase [Blastocatellia bacterium]MCX7752745.1 acyl-CoA thioesterase [Blastocatellia bacterium]MDW8167478.1 thioesterase family protein [Acidobacteriota bacterium]MDW8256825.1 thioesterase family protein [Acidobacteriota bacterium]